MKASVFNAASRSLPAVGRIELSVASQFADGYYAVKQALNEQHARERMQEICVSRGTRIVSLRKVR